MWWRQRVGDGDGSSAPGGGVFAKSWEEAGNTTPPSLHGVPYEWMTDDPVTPLDEAHGFEPHFDRHVWIYRDNPAGVFTPFNANVTCTHATHKPAG